MKRLAPIALIFIALTGCQAGSDSPAAEMTPQPAITIEGDSGVLGAWNAENVTAQAAPEPAAATVPAPETDPIPEGWHCNGPAYQCRGAEAEREREQAQREWMEEQEYWQRQGEEEAEAEANAPHTCEGAGIYGDYSPEGYEDC